MGDYPILIIAIVTLYSFGHWIGASVLVVYTLWGLGHLSVPDLIKELRNG